MDEYTLTRKATVRTGDKSFVKADSENAKITSPEAAFIVKNQAGGYLNETANRYHWQKEKALARKFMFNQADKFLVKGSKDDQCSLEEVSVPKGYLLNRTEIPFTMEKNSYATDGQRTVSLHAINKKVKGLGFLPKTNEERSTWLTIAGLLIIGVVIIWLSYQKQKGGEKG